MIALDLTNSVFTSAKLDKINFMNTNVSGMNFAKFNLTKGNFINSITCNTIFPWGEDIEKC